MKVLDANIDPMNGYSNPAKLHLLVDKIPERSEMVYEQKGSLYFAEKDGLCKFYAYTAPGNGYGGNEFTINMKDGTTKVLKGPWSSRSGCMNRFFTHSVEVTITDDKDHWDLYEKTGMTSVAVTIDVIVDALKFIPAWSVICIDEGEGMDITYNFAKVWPSNRVIYDATVREWEG